MAAFSKGIGGRGAGTRRRLGPSWAGLACRAAGARTAATTRSGHPAAPMCGSQGEAACRAPGLCCSKSLPLTCASPPFGIPTHLPIGLPCSLPHSPKPPHKHPQLLDRGRLGARHIAGPVCRADGVRQRRRHQRQHRLPQGGWVAAGLAVCRHSHRATQAGRQAGSRAARQPGSTICWMAGLLGSLAPLHASLSARLPACPSWRCCPLPCRRCHRRQPQQPVQ